MWVPFYRLCLGLCQKEKVSWEYRPCLLPDCGFQVTALSFSCCQAFSTVMDCNLKLEVKKTRSLLKFYFAVAAATTKTNPLLYSSSFCLLFLLNTSLIYCIIKNFYWNISFLSLNILVPFLFISPNCLEHSKQPINICWIHRASQKRRYSKTSKLILIWLF